MSDARLQTEALSVAEYSARLGRAVREVGAALVEGEIQKVHRTPRGLWYFDLTDGEALLTCKMFPRDAALLEQPCARGISSRFRSTAPTCSPPAVRSA